MCDPFAAPPFIASARPPGYEAISFKLRRARPPETLGDATTKFANFEIDIVGYEVPFTGPQSFFHRTRLRARVLVRDLVSSVRMILRRAGASGRAGGDARRLIYAAKDRGLKCNKSINVGFIFFPRFNLFPLFFFLFFFSGTPLKHESELPAATGARRARA